MLGVKGGTVRGWLSQQRLRPRQGREALIGAMGNQELERKARTGGKLIPFSLRERLCEMKGARLSVWLAHLLHSDKKGVSWPSLSLLEAETSYSRKEIIRTGKKLRESSWLVAESKKQPRQVRGRFSVLRYVVSIPTVATKSPHGQSHRTDKKNPHRGDKSPPRSTTEKEYKGSSPASRGGMSSFQELLKKLEAIYRERRGITPTWVKKDYSALMRLWEQPHVTDRKIERRFRPYLESGDAFCERNGFSLGLFCSPALMLLPSSHQGCRMPNRTGDLL